MIESHNLTEVIDLLGRRYAVARAHRPHESGGLVFRSASAVAGDLTVDAVTLRQTAVEADTEPFTSVTVICLLDGRYSVQAGRDVHRLGRGESALFVPGVPLVTGGEQIQCHTVQFPLSALRPAASGLGIDPADLRFEASAPVSKAMDRHWRYTAAYLSRSFAGPEPAVTHPLVLAGAIETAATAVVAAFPNTTMTAGYTAGPGQVSPAVVRRAVAYIDAHAAEPITLTEIADAAGIGVRGLQAAFARHRDTTPTGYLRRVRLENAHRELQTADRTRGDTVGAIARRWGFLAPGRFAVEYRRAYGQPPDHTLRT